MKDRASPEFQRLQVPAQKQDNNMLVEFGQPLPESAEVDRDGEPERPDKPLGTPDKPLGSSQSNGPGQASAAQEQYSSKDPSQKQQF